MNDGPEDGAPVPADPMSDMQTGAVLFHSMFVAYVGAGFTEQQACIILGTYLAQYARGGAT